MEWLHEVKSSGCGIVSERATGFLPCTLQSVRRGATGWPAGQILGRVIRQRKRAEKRYRCEVGLSYLYSQSTKSVIARQRANCAIYASWQGRDRPLADRSRAICCPGPIAGCAGIPEEADDCQGASTRSWSGIARIPPVYSSRSRWQQSLSRSCL